MTYTHLIVLKNSHDSLSIKEFLDIALVSASYDLWFAIPLFAEVSTTLYEQPLTPVLLSQLQADSRHVLVF